MKEKTQFYVFVIVITSMYMRVFKCTPGQTTKVFFVIEEKWKKKMFALITVVVTVHRVKVERNRDAIRDKPEGHNSFVFFLVFIFFSSFHLLFSLLNSALAYIKTKS